MFNVIVIDDEPVILRDIKNSIETLDANFKVIGTATDGKTGLQLIQDLIPDVVFVDICMPVLGGLELIKMLREEGNMIPVVILSGYQEFEYAKTAIRLDVIDYLIKPMHPMALKNFLKQLSEKLLYELRKKQKNVLEEIFYSKPLSRVNTSIFQLNEKYILTKICFGAFNFFRNNQFASMYADNNILIFKQLCEQKWTNNYWLIEGKYDNEYLLVTIFSKEESNGNIIKLYSELQDYLAPKRYVTFVTSEYSVKLKDLRKELSVLEEKLYHNTIFGKSSYITSGSKTILNQHTLDIDYNYVEVLVKSKKKNELLMYIKQTLKDCHDSNCTQADLILILRNLMHSCCPKEATDEIDFINNLTIVNSCDYRTLYNKLCETIIEYSGIDERNLIGDTNSIYSMNNVKEYLDNHYQEKVQINEVAEKFGFNCSYLCHLFKKYYKVSPNEYIIIKRIELSKKLLTMNEETSIKEVSSTVGYEDPYYFSRIFKSYTGESPTKYRKEKRGKYSNL